MIVKILTIAFVYLFITAESKSRFKFRWGWNGDRDSDDADDVTITPRPTPRPNSIMSAAVVKAMERLCVGLENGNITYADTSYDEVFEAMGLVCEQLMAYLYPEPEILTPEPTDSAALVETTSTSTVESTPSGEGSTASNDLGVSKASPVDVSNSLDVAESPDLDVVLTGRRKRSVGGFHNMHYEGVGRWDGYHGRPFDRWNSADRDDKWRPRPSYLPWQRPDAVTLLFRICNDIERLLRNVPADTSEDLLNIFNETGEACEVAEEVRAQSNQRL